MAPPTKKLRLTKAKSNVSKPPEWIFGKQHPGASSARANAARTYAQPTSNKTIQDEHTDLARKLAVKSIKLTPALNENNKLSREIKELKTKLATQPDLSIQLEEAKYDLEAQNYFDNRARHYAYIRAVAKARATRAMHPGSRYLALKATLPYRDYPEGPAIYSLV